MHFPYLEYSKLESFSTACCCLIHHCSLVHWDYKSFQRSTMADGFGKWVGFSQQNISIFCDNQSVIHLFRNYLFHERTKDIDIRLYWIRDTLSNGTVQTWKIHTSDNPSDFMTKVVTANKFRHCLNLLKIEGGWVALGKDNVQQDWSYKVKSKYAKVEIVTGVTHSVL